MDTTKKLRRDILEASFEANACHVKSALTCAGILIDLFDNILKKEDVFLFGKASGVAAYYAVLAKQGYFPKEQTAEYLRKYPLPSVEVPGVVHSFGSLGHALPVATGMALADKNRRIFVLIGDGDLQEGTFWESVLFKEQHKLDNLHIIWDSNGLQALGKVDEILKLPKEFIESMGVEIVETKTGVARFDNDYTWHYRNLTPELLDKALKQI